MKKILLFIVTILFASSGALAAAKELYILPDYLEIPMPDKGWEITYPNDNNKIIEITAKKAKKDDFFPPRFVISRLPVDKNSKRKWKEIVEKRSSALYPKSYPVPGADEDKHIVSYSFSEHYLPLEGLGLATLKNDYIYLVECQRQDKEDGGKKSILKWCQDYFNNIIWPENLKYEPNGKDFFARWSSFEFDPAGLEREHKKLLGKIKKGVIQEVILEDYIGLVITDSLFSSNPLDPATVLEKLNIVETHLKDSGDAALKTITSTHKEFLNSRFDNVEKNIAHIVKTEPSPPYWLLSKWIREKDRSAAVSFATRSTIAYPTSVSKYTLAAYYVEDSKDIEPLLSKAGAKNTLILALLASDAIKRGKIKEAKKYLDSGESVDPNDTNLLFSRAKLYSAEGGENSFDKANAVYKRLSDIPNISLEKKINLYFEWANLVFDPDQKIDLYNKIITLKEDAAEAYYSLGKVYLIEKRELGKALSNFKDFLKHASATDPKVQELRGLVWRLETQGEQGEQ